MLTDALEEDTVSATMCLDEYHVSEEGIDRASPIPFW
jgi:hypothetical protein